MASIPLAIAALAVLSGVAQLVLALEIRLYCADRTFVGGSLDRLCDVGDDGGYIVGILVPPVVVLVAGFVSINRRSWRPGT
jgi:hypothetical protein